VHASHLDLLGDTLDAVLIATPPATHFEIAKAALLAGKHVLVEKPPAATIAETEELIRLSVERGKVLFFAFHARYNSSVQQAKLEIGSTPVRGIKATYKEDVFRYHGQNSWVLREGVLRDSGINAVSVITEVLPSGTPLTITNASLTRSPELDAVTLGRITFQFGQGGEGVLEMDWRHEESEIRQIEFQTDAGEYRVDIVEDTLWRDGVRVPPQGPAGGQLNGEYERMLDDFALHLENGLSKVSTLELALVETAQAY
jgi:predicted dehydrogenase